MLSVDIELALVGLVAMLEPATLISSAMALVIGERPLRTGFWFYVGGLGATLSVGVIAAFVLGGAAATPSSTPRTWVLILDVIAGVLLLAYVVRALTRPPNPEALHSVIERMGRVAEAPAIRIVAAGAVLANAGAFMVVALKDISQLNPTAGQYILDWTIFALASMLPLGLGLVLLRVAPNRAGPVLAAARRFIERHARTIVLVIIFALAISLLREGIAGLT
jgi:hypothetical protein